MCTKIQTILQLEEDLTVMDYEIRRKYVRYSKTVRTNNLGNFPKKLTECGARYPDIAFFSDTISLKRRTFSWAGPVIGGIVGAIGKYILDLFLIS